MMDKKNVFIIGSKGIPANYGGFETFVDKLVSNQENNDIQYFISCLSTEESAFEYKGAICKNIAVPKIGSARAVLYDILSLKWIINYIERNKLKDGVVCILACRIGPFVNHYKKRLKQKGFKVVLNPDGHEWKRSKWPYLVKKYWKFSEKLMVKYADYVVCDSKGIKSYIDNTYKKYNPKSTYIAYGADVPEKVVEDSRKYREWKINKNINNPYFLVVGRFVPENNIELIIKEFMMTNIPYDLVFVTNVEKNKFYSKLESKTHFNVDERIKFVGTVYDQELLTEIRQNAVAYIHGHSVGGTNPSLLEALGTTNVNLLFNVNFNKEVAEESALYFSSDKGSLSSLLVKVTQFNNEKINELGNNAKKVIKDRYAWKQIVEGYEKVFVDGV
ncbi:DUF1972 domain-containing protein [Pediococcus acidilactici]|uniref:beta 1-4 rhamnosyltransferase Cps2T n=1 Tax=Pediococcus acidilactici TaxID=1254 RepID=UPI00237F24AD|nr:DUF1972 domain-containing protein [Pediococcus acidilactici]WDV25779.1 DUF1972 domain-containing protein [Pediococcus acidilactici]WEE14844.1 DUF1972 domain-containing protein [Pediococcus acidilactici]